MNRFPWVLFLSCALAAHAQTAGWPFAGFDLTNSHFGSTESTLGVSNVSNLALQWSVPVTNDVSATPSVDASGAVYFPDWNGNIWKVDGQTGTVVWCEN